MSYSNIYIRRLLLLITIDREKEPQSTPPDLHTIFAYQFKFILLFFFIFLLPFSYSQFAVSFIQLPVVLNVHLSNFNISLVSILIHYSENAVVLQYFVFFLNLDLSHIALFSLVSSFFITDFQYFFCFCFVCLLILCIAFFFLGNMLQFCAQKQYQRVGEASDADSSVCRNFDHP